MPSACSPAVPGLATPGCRSHQPGHVPHVLHARLLSRSPWGWRDGTLTSVSSDGWLTVACTTEVGTVRAWHHADLTGRLAPGEAVRVHERHSALAARRGVVSLHVEHGVGVIPEPVELDVWASAGATVIDLRTATLALSGPRTPA